MDFAQRKLAKGKATGLDQLSDHWLKNSQIWEATKEKIKRIFSGWINGEQLPEYLKRGRVFCLSKEDAQFPKEGKIRTITILSTFFKLYELVVQKKLQEESKRLQFIPSNQLGFSSETIGAQEHIMQIARLMAKSKEKQETYRRDGVPVPRGMRSLMDAGNSRQRGRKVLGHVKHSRDHESGEHLAEHEGGTNPITLRANKPGTDLVLWSTC